MTIMVVLSQIILLSNFNAALGYDLSHHKQVLLKHPRTHLHACTHTHVHARTKCFLLASADVPHCAHVSQIQAVCVFTSHLSKNVSQLCEAGAT